MWDKDANIGSIIQIEAIVTDQKNKKSSLFKLLFHSLTKNIQFMQL